MSDSNTNPSGGSNSRPVSRSTQTGSNSNMSTDSNSGSSSGAAGAGGNRGGGGLRGNRGGVGGNSGGSGASRGSRGYRGRYRSARSFPRRRPVRPYRSRSATPRATSSGGGSPTSRPSSAGSGGGSGGIPHHSPTLINDAETICTICQNQITNLCITDCNHRFCRDCIRRWTSRNATCPSCRTNIRTIRHILPDGGTETILISRAELLAHKVNEIHSILMILFTVVSHTLLPEVSNYLDQLNQIARELNVPTTSSRMENVAAAADAAAAEMGATNSPASAAARATSPSSPVPQARPAAPQPATSQPATNQTASSQAGNQPTSRTGIQPASQTGSQPASQIGSQPSSQTGGQQAQAQSVPPRGASPPGSAALRGAIGGGLIFAARSVTPGSSSQPSSGLTASRADSGYGSSVSDNPNIRHTYLAANQSAATNPAAAAASNPSSPAQQPAGQQSPQHPRSLSISGARNFILRAAASRRQTAPLTPGPATRSQISLQQAIDRTIGARQLPSGVRGQPPSPEELAQAQEQRQRDIRFLTDSYNKINQVYEVLMIMHMVIHRNQVELDPLPSSSTGDADVDSD